MLIFFRFCIERTLNDDSKNKINIFSLLDSRIIVVGR